MLRSCRAGVDPSAEADERRGGPVDVPDPVQQATPAPQRPRVGQLPDRLLHQGAQPGLEAVVVAFGRRALVVGASVPDRRVPARGPWPSLGIPVDQAVTPVASRTARTPGAPGAAGRAGLLPGRRPGPPRRTNPPRTSRRRSPRRRGRLGQLRRRPPDRLMAAPHTHPATNGRRRTR